MSDADMRLSPNFRLGEMVQSQTAVRKGINNFPTDPQVIENLKLVCEKILEPVRAHYKKAITPNSGYRSPALNAAVGGSKTSQHMTGQAVDFVVPGVACDQVRDWIVANLDFDQVILEYYNPQKGTGWVHCSYTKNKNRKQSLKIG